MARKKRSTQQKEVQDYRHDTATRKNNPPAGIAAQGRIQETPKQEYAYNPHLPPNLRFDPNGDADKLPELLQKAQQQTLTAEEAKTLADALRHHSPWLEWAGKQETKSFTVDPVALHIHERVSAKAILKVAERQNVQRELFADPQQDYSKAVDFYQHDVDWANRLILGDSLTVMSSLAHREDLAGKVQMIYIDPPYGIKFASNFQPTVFQRDVKDREQDLTREREQIKAYRDTWTLGVHSYLAYLRDRLIVAKELLTDSGSIFVQISDENIHRVRCIMDEVFGSENFISQLVFTKTRSLVSSDFVTTICDYILWYAKDRNLAKEKMRKVFLKRQDSSLASHYENSYGEILTLGEHNLKLQNSESVDDYKPFMSDNLIRRPNPEIKFDWQGRKIEGRFRTNEQGLKRLLPANRILFTRSGIRYKFFLDDFPVSPLNHLWDDVIGAQNPIYAVQTNTQVIERCLLMTTDPGDIVLDPTCGSGSTAYVAENWGRRWITLDTSRVAVALARQRLLTASFDYYELKDKPRGIAGGFINKTVPHITLKSIAQNTALDPIFAKHEPILKDKLDLLNHALAEVTPQLRSKLLAKLAEKEKREGKRSITDADRRRWILPETAWKEWEVPFDTDPDSPNALQKALTDYRKAWRAKMDEVSNCIAKSSEGEELVDQPEIDRKRIRVSGPFTVEAVQPAEESLDTESPISGEPEEVPDTFDAETDGNNTVNAEAYLDQMIRLLQNDGVRFPNNQTLKFATLDPIEGDILHAEGSWENDDTERLVAVVFGPQHGPVTAMQVEDCLPIASRRGYNELVFAGFSFDGAAQAIIQEDPNPRVRIHMAHINPDVAMGDLLKETPSTQLFTVFGMPRTQLEETADGEYYIKMEGVDIYNPVDNTVNSAGADKVAAWFVDSDYDGRTFCITQAFFPDKSAWKKIARALKGVIDEDQFEKFSGTESLPFSVGEHACVAVKVIDPRGNEVMSVHNLKDRYYSEAHK
ncbi:MAG: site-specific DNA-methyltransferase [Candidatus Poribacteria bacterium]|nr:site-specific DNA-methyltransferase [Candidatus Poribacteria bacterium]